MITYIDLDIQKIVFSTLVIKVSTVVEKFGSIEKFSTQHNFTGVTNGTIVMTAEMSSPPFQLEEFAQKVLIANGLELQKDFLFIEEMLTQGARGEVSELINEPHPECNEVKWLESVIVSSGNYIWFSEPSLSDFERDANFRLFKNLLYCDADKIQLNPRITHINETYVHYTVSDSKMNYKIHRDALWYNELKYGKK
ncbi:MAG: hypothetical protein RSE15_01630 [Flavobacterium sp.]|uniref:hypothetical protein n=1 Tax=Flavobacterium sp. TaxID=239 RepID=UPI002B46E918|nr:hypothetical protein [Flavobacterium sp.]WRH73543.1 MAG: hypothetical protein RSE15_01630 [Flavobacterium sp.]